MYRDDREALLHRIATLEADARELEALRTRVAFLEAENQKLTAELHALRPPPPRIPVASGPPTGAVLRLRLHGPGVDGVASFDQDTIKIGRLKTAHLRLEHPDVSRLHAVIERSSDGFAIIDLGATDGTHVNDERTNKAQLRVGDVIRVGPFTMTVEP